MGNYGDMIGERKRIAILENNDRIKRQVGQCPFNKTPGRVTIHGLVEVCYRNLNITRKYDHSGDIFGKVTLACEKCKRPDWDQLFNGTLEKVGLTEIITDEEYERMKKRYE